MWYDEGRGGGVIPPWGWVPAIVESPVWESRQLRAEEERWRWCECHQGSQSVGRQEGKRAFFQGVKGSLAKEVSAVVACIESEQDFLSVVITLSGGRWKDKDLTPKRVDTPQQVWGQVLYQRKGSAGQPEHFLETSCCRKEIWQEIRTRMWGELLGKEASRWDQYEHLNFSSVIDTLTQHDCKYPDQWSNFTYQGFFFAIHMSSPISNRS